LHDARLNDIIKIQIVIQKAQMHTHTHTSNKMTQTNMRLEQLYNFWFQNWPTELAAQLNNCGQTDKSSAAKQNNILEFPSK